MYCPNCGKQQLSKANFCIHCGTSVDVGYVPNDDLSLEAQRSTEFQKEPKLEPGQLQHAWRNLSSRYWDPRPHDRYSKDLDQLWWKDMYWLHGGEELDVFITENYFIVLAPFAETKVKQVSERISLASSLAPIAGLFVGLPVAIVGEAYERLFGQKHKVDPHALTILFKSGMMMYAKKSDLSFTSFHLKNSVFQADYSHIAVVGDFQNAVVGHVNLCFLLREDESWGGNIQFLGDVHFLGPLKASGCVVTEHTEKFSSTSQLETFLSKDYPDPLIATKKYMRLCSNCAHFKLQKNWDTYGFLSSNLKGDCTSSNRVSDEKLPCKIASEVSATWDEYFKLKNRTCFYPKDCPKFKYRDE